MATDRDALMQAALPHVPFDGWSDVAFEAAAKDCGLDLAEARAVAPRGALDLAVAYHRQGDSQMREALAAADLDTMRIRERVTFAVRTRLELTGDKEIVRRGSALFALPQNAGEGAALIWGTADAIWDALGDPSDDVNWYSKRAILSGVYSATVLFWLGDDSDGAEATWAFLDRRIGDVMAFEKFKAGVQGNPVLNRLFSGPASLLSRIKAPSKTARDDLPGHWPDKI